MTMNGEAGTTGAGVVGEIARDCLMTRTRRISRIITNLYDQALRPYGINAPQFMPPRGRGSASGGRSGEDRRNPLIGD